MALTKKITNRALKVAALAATFAPVVAHGAACDPTIQGGAECARGNLTFDPLTSQIQNIVNTLIFASGIIAVVFIIVGGLRYILSQGDEKAVQGAKNTVLYAVIGLVVVILAFAIVNFVLSGVSSGKPS